MARRAHAFVNVGTWTVHGHYAQQLQLRRWVSSAWEHLRREGTGDKFCSNAIAAGFAVDSSNTPVLV